MYLSPYKVDLHAGEAVVQENDETRLFSNGDLIAGFRHREPQNSLGKIKKITFIAQFANLNIIVPHCIYNFPNFTIWTS